MDQELDKSFVIRSPITMSVDARGGTIYTGNAPYRHIHFRPEQYLTLYTCVYAVSVAPPSVNVSKPSTMLMIE